MAEESNRSAAYLPWPTFKNALEQLAKGIPSRIDRSVFATIAWNVQTQLFAGMRFLGLLKGDDEPTSVLADLVKGSEEERKEKLKKVIEERYSALIAIDLTKATRAHFEEEFGKLYGATGDTRVKAIRFFLAAAVYVGIPLSTFILPAKDGKPAAPKPRPHPRPRLAVKKAPEGIPTKDKGEAGNGRGMSRSFSLVSGASLTLSANVDFMALPLADRKFVADLIDKIEVYEGEGKK